MRKFFGLGISLMAFLCGYAQNPADRFLKNLTPVSPQAASLIKAINHPTDLSRGLVNISIPLYEVKVNDISIPIFLNYHAGGIRMLDHSGIIGIGWSLSAEPQITRAIQGLRDEDGYFLNAGTGTTGDAYLRNWADGVADESPDNFYYNALGESGSFMYKKTINPIAVTPVLFPYKPLKIETLKTSGTIDRFKITDPSGRQVFYGGGPETNYGYVESSIGGNSNGITAWKANYIVSADLKDTVYFTYYNKGYLYMPIPSDQKITVEDEFTQIMVAYPSGADNGRIIKYLADGQCQHYKYPQTGTSLETCSNCGACTFDGGVGQRQVTILYPNQIKFRGGKLVFTPSSVNQYMVGTIQVYNDNNKLLRQIELYQSGYRGVPNGAPRYLLDSVNVFSGDLLHKEHYGLEYNQTGTLPDYIDLYASDPWGFYNGGDPYYLSAVSTQLISSLRITMEGGTTSQFYIGNNGRTYPGDGKKLMLNKMIYPTGGNTVFEYEKNKYYTGAYGWGITGTTAEAGGYRIKSITEYDNLGTRLKKRSFRYGFTEDGGGLARHSSITNDMYNTEQINEYYDNSSIVVRTSKLRTFSVNPVVNMYYLAGAPVTYPFVTEYDGDPPNVNGKTIYEYSFPGPSSFTWLSGTTLNLKQPKDWEMGQLMRVSRFRDIGSGVYDTISTTTNTYLLAHTLDTVYFGDIYKKRNRIGYNGSVVVGPDELQYYRSNYVNGAFLLQEAKEEYWQYYGHKTTSVTQYTYANNSHLLPTTITTTRSEGNSSIVNNYYPQDIANNSTIYQSLTGTAQQAVQTMITSNIVNVPVQEEKRIGVDLLYTTRKNFKNINGSVYTDNIETRQRNNAFEQRAAISLYDNFGNVLEQSKTNDVKQSFIWDYRYRHPVAMVTGAAVADIAFTSFEADGTGNFTLTGGTPTTSYAMTGNKSYTLSTGNTIVKSGLQSTIPYTISYWSRNGSLSINTGSGVAGLTKNGWTCYTHQVTPASGVITISGNATIDELRLYPKGCFMLSYTYELLIGVTAQTDANNQVTYYEYDGFGRLVRVRDIDQNILKQYDYQYMLSNSGTAN